MWQYDNNELTEELIPKKAIGFIYLITNINTKKKYIGRKLLTKAAYKTIKGIKKAIRKKSDYEIYYSSSPEIKKEIEIFGTDIFKREILLFCESKSILNYYEEKLQYEIGVLESLEYYNSNIRAKVFKRNILNKTIEQYKNCIIKCKN